MGDVVLGYDDVLCRVVGSYHNMTTHHILEVLNNG